MIRSRVQDQADPEERPTPAIFQPHAMERRILTLENDAKNYVTQLQLEKLKNRALWILLVATLGAGALGNKLLGVLSAVFKSSTP